MNPSDDLDFRHHSYKEMRQVTGSTEVRRSRTCDVQHLLLFGQPKAVGHVDGSISSLSLGTMEPRL